MKTDWKFYWDFNPRHTCQYDTFRNLTEIWDELASETDTRLQKVVSELVNNCLVADNSPMVIDECLPTFSDGLVENPAHFDPNQTERMQNKEEEKATTKNVLGNKSMKGYFLGKEEARFPIFKVEVRYFLSVIIIK